MINFVAGYLPSMPSNGCWGSGGDFCVWGWPFPVYDGISYFFSTIKSLNFFLPLGGSGGWFAAIIFLISYFSLIFFPLKIILKVFKRN